MNLTFLHLCYSCVVDDDEYLVELYQFEDTSDKREKVTLHSLTSLHSVTTSQNTKPRFLQPVDQCSGSTELKSAFWSNVT